MKKYWLPLVLLLSCSAEKQENQAYDYWEDRVLFEPHYQVEDLSMHSAFKGKQSTAGELAELPEISGLVMSKKYAGYAWAIEDSGNPPELSLIRLQDARLIARFRDTALQNMDWEDIAAYSSRDGKSKLIVSDMGDNKENRSSYVLYYLDEPDFVEGQDSGLIYRSFQAFRKVVHYADGKSHDSEALFVDQDTRNVFIVTKRESRSMVFGLKAENMETEWDTALYCGSFPFNMVTAADLSPERKLIIRNYLDVMVWEWEASSNLLDVMADVPKRLPYDRMEPQGESAAWTTGSDGYYLISESLFNLPPQLHLWK